MNLKELEELISKGEGQQLEFKLKAAYPEKIVKEFVAFANTDGGQLFVGVDDNGRIAGSKFAEEDRYVIDRAIADHIKPGIKYHFEFIQINQKRSVLHYKVFETRKKPIYYLPDPQERGMALVRVKDKSVKASREMVEILRRSKTNKSYPVRLNDTAHQLFRHLAANGKATLNDFMEISGLSKYKASQILVSLVISNILKIEIGDKVDYYSMKEIEEHN
jgi:predicted HTH transcriptional regulator